MDIKRFLAGLKVILTYDPITTLKMIAKGTDEQAETARYVIYIINFIAANLGLVILIITAYVWFSYIEPNHCNVRVVIPTFLNGTSFINGS